MAMLLNTPQTLPGILHHFSLCPFFFAINSPHFKIMATFIKVCLGKILQGFDEIFRIENDMFDCKGFGRMLCFAGK